jgi:hypothetical protein
MARISSISQHPQRVAIEAAMVSGEPFRAIARRFGVERGALARYRKHLAPTIARAVEVREARTIVEVATQIERAEYLVAHALHTLKTAHAAGQHKLALQANDTMREAIAFLSKLAGLGAPDHQTNVQVNINQDQGWLRIRSTIVEALAPFPEARIAVAEALARLDNDA